MVDDEPKIRELVKRALEPYHYYVVTASNGEQGLQYAQRHRVDLILLDLMMPKMDGFDVLLRLKASASTIGIPVVILTAKSDSQSILQSQALLARDYLVKPFDLEVLVRTVIRYAKPQRLEQEIPS